MKAIVFERSLPRFGAALVAGALRPGAGAKVGPLRLADVDPPELPGPDWVQVKPRLAGICGSDLSTIDAKSSRYFDPIVSFPFTLGHEIVGDLIDPGAGAIEADGRNRVVVEPVLGCVSRNISPLCSYCASGDLGGCVNIAFGELSPGLQSGFCCDTGGGWSTAMVAHRSQLHSVPSEMTDEAAVMIEPTACAIHAVFAADASAPDRVVVIGSGTLGLLTIAALRRFSDVKGIISVAKHPAQRAFARSLLGDDNEDVLVAPDEMKRAVRRITGAMALGDGHISRLSGGADVVIDCVGTESSIADALAVVRPGGRIVLVGMPGEVKVDLTPLWQREISLVGAYAYGTESVFSTPPTVSAPPAGAAVGATSRRRTFDLAFELVQSAQLERLVSDSYPLDRFDDAVAHAANAGSRGAVKIVFDLRLEKERDRV